jgi:multiple sugar transport system permease protein
MSRRSQATLIYAVLIALAIIILLPVWSMVTTAFTPEGIVFMDGARLWPSKLTFENFRKLGKAFPFGRWYVNSVITSTLFTVGQVISCSMTAFALSYFSFRGRDALLLVVLGTIMLPFQVIMVPLFWLMKTIGLTNSLVALWLPAFFGDITGSFGIFLLRQAFLQIPKEYSEAARLDGANPFKVFTSIYLPMVRPFLSVVVVFSFMTSWNDFIRPIVYITDMDLMTVTGGLSFFQSQWSVSWGPLMAGTLLATLPTLVLYLVAQKQFMQMAVSAGIKG